LLVANLTPRVEDIIIGPLHGPVTIRRLNEATAEHAGAEPAAFRRKSEREDTSGERALTLEPYEVVRVDLTDS
jgi:hypothetical protein